MLRSKSRYTDSMLRGLGLSPIYNDLPNFVPSDNCLQELLQWSKGDFANIIDYIYDGEHVNSFDLLTSTNTPQYVRDFINNFLMKRIQVVPSMLNDDDAFDSIIPRSAQTASELSPYLGKLKSIVSDFRKQSVSDSKTDVDGR